MKQYKQHLITTWIDLLGVLQAVEYIRHNQATSTNVTLIIRRKEF